MSDQDLPDHLVTALVHFDLVGSDAEEADAKARRLLEIEVEDSNLFGAGRVATVRPGAGEREGHVYEASAVVLFRQIGENPVEAASIAASRLQDEIMASGLLSSGGVAFTERD